MRNDEIRNEGANRLVPLSDSSDFKVAKDNPDVRGWRVVGADGESLGMVKDLIVDPQAMKVRYLSVVGDRRFFNNEKDQHLLVPIGAAALDKKGRKIFVSHIDSKSISKYPVYPGGPIPEDYEYAVRETFMHSHNQTMGGTTEYRDSDRSDYRDTDLNNNQQQPVSTRRISSDFYDNDSYNENQFYSANRHDDQSDNNYRARDTDYERSNNTDYVPGTTADTYNQDNGPKNVEESIATIERLEQLRERGSITEDEFRVLKKRALDF